MKKENMKLKRYGHIMKYLNGFVYAIGGFSHKDLPDELPVTLASCERYNHHDNSWAYISTMNEPRAFAAAVCLENQFIYVFGGFKDYLPQSTIEKYETLNDNWIQLHIKLPVPLAKHGALLLD